MNKLMMMTMTYILVGLYAVQQKYSGLTFLDLTQ